LEQMLSPLVRNREPIISAIENKPVPENGPVIPRALDEANVRCLFEFLSAPGMKLPNEPAVQIQNLDAVVPAVANRET